MILDMAETASFAKRLVNPWDFLHHPQSDVF
jgi:hypothetical protein